jgi:DNA-binding NarL/FixJ family response regulator
MTLTQPIRVLCVDDHPLFREGVAAAVSFQTDMSLTGTASNAAEAIRQFRLIQPDVTLMDLRLPDRPGTAAISSIRSEFPSARVLVLTSFDGDANIQRALAAGACGYILKSAPPAELMTMIRNVHMGRLALPNQVAQSLAQHIGSDALTEREIDVLRNIAEGNRNQDVARVLLISEATVKTYVSTILEKLGARDRTQAVSIGLRRGIIHL